MGHNKLYTTILIYRPSFVIDYMHEKCAEFFSHGVLLCSSQFLKANKSNCNSPCHKLQIMPRSKFLHVFYFCKLGRYFILTWKPMIHAPLMEAETEDGHQPLEGTGK